MQWSICLLPVVPMRKEPSHRSEMVSQILFGEFVLLGEEKDDFVFVRCDYDGYEGWVQANQLTLIDESERMEAGEFTAAFATPVAKNDTLLQVPFGCPVYQQDGFSFSVGDLRMRYLMQPQQVWRSEQLSLSAESLQAVCQPFLNAPYLWGGKSPWGTDCSGFVQQVFKLFGLRLLRDAYLQVEQGKALPSLEEARLGDLAFFRNENGRVTHVGIILNDGKVAHASGRVRIDTLNADGIRNVETGRQTHVFHSVRRFF